MIKIRDVEIYHSKNKINNEIYVKDNERHRHFLEDILGKKERYICDEDENVLTMMLKVCEKLLNKNKLKGEDFDLLIAVSQTPEYFVPPISAILHNHLKIKQESFFYDINVACSGMNTAFYQCSQMMKQDKKIKRTLIVCCDLNRLYINEDSCMYGNCGDLSCAIIVEQDEKNESQFIDNLTFTDTSQSSYINLPIGGFSDLRRKVNDIDFLHFELDERTNGRLDLSVEQIQKILKNNNLEINDISMFCFSQYMYRHTLKLRESLNIPIDKSLYVGDIYGYNGGSSPFVVLHKAINEQKIKRGDYILFWTIGAGLQGIVSLIKY